MKTTDLAGFFIAGLMNNMPFVIMNAGAKDIAPDLVGLVYVANIVPGLMMKLTGPYWFHHVPYKLRVLITAFQMSASFALVAIGLQLDIFALMLLGVAIGSSQAGFGEASFLALTSFYDSRRALTAWSSGTGLAGIMGYGWVVLFTSGLGMSFQLTMLCALVLPVSAYMNYLFVLSPPTKEKPAYSLLDDVEETDAKDVKEFGNEPLLENEESSSAKMTTAERLRLSLDLWPYMFPLFLVYFSEYAMQSGVWAAIGFPIDSDSARKDFYRYSNWMYQGGVLVSRSSGMLWKADMKALWIMPILQTFILVFFIADAYEQWWYDWSLLALCFVVGLFGGAVYVGGFALIADTVPPHLTEFSLGTAAVGADIGIACSNVAAIFIQKALYDYHGVSD
ncbi:unnamed protein product [Ectocarpus fasciculatus]